MTAYTAPFGKAFTEAHIAGDQLDGDGRLLTVCGLAMDPAEWIPIVLQPGDRVHKACTDPGSSSEEQGALL